MQEQIARRVEEVRRRIASAALRCGRDPAGIRLIAVSKGHGADAVAAAMACGLADFGENYAQELEEKASHHSLRVTRDALLPVWHFQGRLQRRKIKDILRYSSSLLSVARVEELAEIEKRAIAPVTCLVEVNIAAEPQKNGAHPDEVEKLLEASLTMKHLHIAGLMAVPPFDQPPEPWFEKLRDLRDRLKLPELSMGMSSDFEVATERGATMVRIGTAIFGARVKK